MSQDFILKVRVALATHNKSQAWLAEKINISTAYIEVSSEVGFEGLLKKVLIFW